MVRTHVYQVPRARYVPFRGGGSVGGDDMAPVVVVVGGGAGAVVIISRRVSIVVIVAGGVLAGGAVHLDHFRGNDVYQLLRQRWRSMNSSTA